MNTLNEMLGRLARMEAGAGNHEQAFSVRTMQDRVQTLLNQQALIPHQGKLHIFDEHIPTLYASLESLEKRS